MRTYNRLLIFFLRDSKYLVIQVSLKETFFPSGEQGFYITVPVRIYHYYKCPEIASPQRGKIYLRSQVEVLVYDQLTTLGL